jgi:hypothetical protein
MSVLQSIPQEGAPPHVDERHALVRERTFPPSELERILLMVHEERLTGTVTLDINQGGLCAIRVKEQQKLK